MSFLQAAFLALVQGITEFLPISSSAHLILVPYFLDWQDQGLSFDIATNTGTLLAVVVYFRKDLAQLARGLFRGGEGAEVEGMPPRHLLWALVLGTIPAAVTGLLLADWIATAGRDPVLIASTSVGFGLLLGAADRWGKRRRRLETLTLGDAVLVGLAQALALIPGTSRSGVTITMAMALGYRRPAAARFSFLLAIPVGLLATLYDAYQIAIGEVTPGHLPEMLVGMVVAAVSAYVVIGALLAWLRKQTMTPFVVYRVLLGLFIYWMTMGW